MPVPWQPTAATQPVQKKMGMSQLLFTIKGKSPADAALNKPLRLQLQPEKYENAHRKNMD